jgi:hypothetical protein
MRRWVLALAIMVGSGGQTLAAFDPDGLSLLLDEGMTGQQVINALHFRPNRIEQRTCGQQTRESWACRIWEFTDGRRTLRVTFQRDTVGWVVNSWGVYRY